MNAIDSKPISNSYLPLDNYKNFKVFMEEQSKNKGKKQQEDKDKSSAEIAAQKAAMDASEKDKNDSLAKNKTFENLQRINPNKERKDYIYRPGGPELKDVLKEEIEKFRRPEDIAII